MTRIYPTKGLDGSTLTKEQWDRYYDEKDKVDDYMEGIKPDPLKYDTLEAYKKAMNEWREKKFMEQPNEPGSIRSYND